MENYTRPNNPEHKDTPKEWLNSALIFARAVSVLLPENKGVVVDLKGDMINPAGTSEKVIIFRNNGMIGIDNFDQNLDEGTICEILN